MQNTKVRIFLLSFPQSHSAFRIPKLFMVLSSQIIRHELDNQGNDISGFDEGVVQWVRQ